MVTPPPTAQTSFFDEPHRPKRGWLVPLLYVVHRGEVGKTTRVDRQREIDDGVQRGMRRHLGRRQPTRIQLPRIELG
jgi:hypothetical protein